MGLEQLPPGSNQEEAWPSREPEMPEGGPLHWCSSSDPETGGRTLGLIP